MAKKRKKVESEEEEDEDDFFNVSESDGSEEEPERQEHFVGDLLNDSEEDDDEEDEEEVEEEDIVTSDDGFDDDLLGDEEDRAKMARMKDVEREGILYERQVERDSKKSRAKAKRLAEAAKKKPKKKRGKQKEATTRSQRSRASRVTDKHSALSDLKERRDRQKAATVRRSELVSDDEIDDMDVEEYDDSDETPRQRRARRARRAARSDDESDDEMAAPARTHTPLTIESLLRIQLRRLQLEKMCEEPYFDEFVVGHFVKLLVGSSKTTGQPSYFCCEIKSVVDYPKEYKLGNKSISRALMLSQGLTQRVWRMDQVSNHTITAHEMQAWLANVGQAGDQPPTCEDVTDRLKASDKKRRDFRYDTHTVDRMIQERKKKSLKHVNVALERTRVERDLQRAQQRDDIEAVARAERRLDDIKEHESKQKQRIGNKFKNIAEINRTNRRQNDRFITELSRMKQESKIAGEDQGKTDPFRRKRTRPTLTWSSSNAKKEGEGEEEKEKKEEEEGKQRPYVDISATNGTDSDMLLLGATPTPKHGDSDDSKALDMRQRLNLNSDLQRLVMEDPAWQSLIRRHDFDIQVDLQQEPQPQARAVHRSRFQQPQPEKIITLEEYEERFEEEVSDDD